MMKYSLLAALLALSMPAFADDDDQYAFTGGSRLILLAGGGGGSYTAGSGLTLTGNTFRLGDANLTYSAGALSLGASATTAGSLTIYNATSGFGELFSDSANVLSLRNSTNAQALRIADSFTDASDYSWAAIVSGQTGGSEACAANTLCLGSWHLGTPGGGGSLTKLNMYVDGTSVFDYGVSLAGAVAVPGGFLVGKSGAGVALTMVSSAGNYIVQAYGGNPNQLSIGSGTTIGFNPNASVTGANDAAFSRVSAGVVGLGNGTAGDFTGTLKLGNQTLTAAAPTVAAAQIGYGSTVAANTNCGTLTLSAGCIVVNVAGTTRYIPYY